MAYADFDFYENVYFGDELTATTAPKWLERASDAIDNITFHRLEQGMPVLEAHVTRVKKAVCAVAEVLYRVDLQRLAASAKKDEQGNIGAAVVSKTSGKESISYVQSTESSVYAKAAADRSMLDALVYAEAERYLADIPDVTGVNLLYMGVSRCATRR